MFRLFVFSTLFASAFAATQCVGSANQQGPPIIPGSCPPGLVFTDDQQCCLEAGVQIVGGGAATTTLAPGATTSFNGFNNFGTTAGIGVGGIGITASGNCVDLLNPRTGVSDCPSRASLCNDPTYYSVMTQQCPRTCNRCSSVTNGGNVGAGGCVDLTNPRTGTSDCPQRAALCNDANYAQLMTQQCPRTCGRCNGSGFTAAGGFTSVNGFTTTVSSINGNCADQVNPNTRISDCPSLRSFCTNSLYRDLMRIQCPVTCNLCSGSNQNNLNVNGIQFG